MFTNWTTAGNILSYLPEVIKTLLVIILIVAAVVIIGLIIWAAVALKAIDTQKDIIQRINKVWDDDDE